LAFQESLYGRRLLESDIPRIVKSLEGIEKALNKIESRLDINEKMREVIK
jgi:hypothetical protein